MRETYCEEWQKSDCFNLVLVYDDAIPEQFFRNQDNKQLWRVMAMHNNMAAFQQLLKLLLVQ